MERLQKIIANSGYASRRKAEELILAGKVKLNNQVVKELGTKAKNTDVIEINGEILDNNKNYEYYLLNKPRGIISSTKDEHNRKTVVDLIETKERIYPIGRLDYDATGIILLTNDGFLANKLMHPSSHIEKTYVAKVEGLVTGNDLKLLRNGIVIDNYKTAKSKAKLKKYDKEKDKSIVEITIHEGKNHQVKKMFQAVGHEVIKLKREKYANLDLTGLKSGEYRKLTNKEIAVLYSLVK